MNVRLFVLAGLLLIAPLLSLRADEPDPEPSLSGKVYKSPQAVFDGYMTASEKKDYKAALACLTPAAQKDMAAYLAFIALSMKSVGVEEIVKAFKPMLDVMDKHGLTEKATKDIKVSFAADKQEQQKARTAISKLIKKPIPFAIDMMKVQVELKPFGGDQFKPKIKLEEVKIDGTRATGLMVVEVQGQQSKQKVNFAKLGSGWKMIPSFDLNPPVPVKPEVDKAPLKDEKR
jgi:hypothetical protein